MDTRKTNTSAIESKTDWTPQDMSENAKIMPMSMERKNIIEKLERMLNFFKSAPIENEDALVFPNSSFPKKHLEELESSLKYIPIGPSFSLLPAEIKTNILNYLCISNAFTAASVCQDWKKILESRLSGITVSLGGTPLPSSDCRILNDYHMCEKCRDPEVMLKALTHHKLDIRLEVHEPIKENIDSKVVAAGLSSVSSLSIFGECSCPDPFDVSYDSDMSLDSEGNIHFDNQWVRNPLSLEQFEDLFKEIEKNEKIMERVVLQGLDLSKLNQDTLIDCLVNKVKHLRLRGTSHGDMLNFGMFIRKLAGESNEFTLNHLTLSKLKLPNELAREIGNALCNVEYVDWDDNVPLQLQTIKQLFQNILTRPVEIKNFICWKRFDCRKLISPEDLKKFLNKMTKLRMEVKITLEQMKAAQSMPDVSIPVDQVGGYTRIKKGGL